MPLDGLSQVPRYDHTGLSLLNFSLEPWSTRFSIAALRRHPTTKPAWKSTIKPLSFRDIDSSLSPLSSITAVSKLHCRAETKGNMDFEWIFARFRRHVYSDVALHVALIFSTIASNSTEVPARTTDTVLQSIFSRMLTIRKHREFDSAHRKTECSSGIDFQRIHPQ